MIEQLPLHIANQIAAGEVVQRPSSIIKELIENSIDAGATRINVWVEDGGRTLIQVSDNGCGMSPEDAPRAFLRHATSKIRTTEDLFNLRTFGFRGEALASISSVADVELTTRRDEDELATKINVCDGVMTSTEQCGANVGTTITVRKLFYSIPARRKFLKSEKYETKLCRTEFYRVAMVHPDVSFEYRDSTNPPLILGPQNNLSRIVSLTKPSYAKNLLPVVADSPLVRVSGYTGTPGIAKAKSGMEQYLFVNGRFFRNLRISKSLGDVYSRLIASTKAPSFFLYIDVDPGSIDVNVNPTKTEVKFEDESSIVHIISSAVKQTLGKYNVVPAIDFEPNLVEVPSYSPQRQFSAGGGGAMVPPSSYGASGGSYNPFNADVFDAGGSVPDDFDAQAAAFDENFMNDTLVPQSFGSSGGGGGGYTPPQGGYSPSVNTHAGYATISSQGFMDTEGQQGSVPLDVSVNYPGVQLCGNKFVAVDSVDGMVVVNVARARCRIEYERLLNARAGGAVPSQLLMIPHTVELTADQKAEVLENSSLYESFGVLVADNGGSEVVITGLPDGFGVEDVEELMGDTSGVGDGASAYEHRLAQLITNNILQQTPLRLSAAEISSLFEQLMECHEPSFTPSGLKVIEIIDTAELENRFKR